MEQFLSRLTISAGLTRLAVRLVGKRRNLPDGPKDFALLPGKSLPGLSWRIDREGRMFIVRAVLLPPWRNW